jgi:RNA-directed DNA polymerase
MDRVRTLTRRRLHRTLADLLSRLNPVLRGCANYFRHGVCKQTFGYVDHYSFWKIVTWIRKRHLGLNWGTIRRRFLPGWEIRPTASRCSGHDRFPSCRTDTGAPESPPHG